MAKDTKPPKTAPAALAFRLPNQKWMERLTQEPAISPTFALVLCDYASSCLIKWLKENAPKEIVDLYFHHSTMREFYAAFEAGRGYVSDSDNEGIAEAVQGGINVLDKLGFTDFETMG